jgi:hypothetical protein
MRQKDESEFAQCLINAVTAEVDLIEANFTGLATHQELSIKIRKVARQSTGYPVQTENKNERL